MNLDRLERLFTSPLLPLGRQSFSLLWILQVLLLVEAALAEPTVLTDPPPKVLLHGLQGQGMAFELWAWISAIHAGLSLRSSLNDAIEQGLRERRIELAGARQQIQLLSSRHDSAQEGDARHWRPLPDHPWFRSMDERRMRELVGSGARRWVPAGTVLVRQGEEGQSF